MKLILQVVGVDSPAQIKVLLPKCWETFGIACILFYFSPRPLLLVIFLTVFYNWVLRPASVTQYCTHIHVYLHKIYSIYSQKIVSAQHITLLHKPLLWVLPRTRSKSSSGMDRVATSKVLPGLCCSTMANPN